MIELRKPSERRVRDVPYSQLITPDSGTIELQVAYREQVTSIGHEFDR
jgi:hypothetical protein